MKKIDYLRVDGKECCRCGVPFYRIVDFDLDKVPETPVTSPLILRNKYDQLQWRWIDRSDAIMLPRRKTTPGWVMQRVDPTPDGLFCKACSKRDDKWIGIEGKPHEVNR